MAIKIVSASLGAPGKGKPIKTVLLKKSGNRMVLQKATKMSLTELEKSASGNELYVTSQYIELISDEVELPPIANEKSLAFLVRHKLQDTLKPGKNYTFVYQKSSSFTEASNQGGKPKKMYTVYAVPADMLDTDYFFTPKLKKNLSLITFDQFGLAALSAKVDPVGMVCHAYADKEKFILSFSIGDNLEYARLAPVPQDISSADELTNFYYENLNLTYLYVQQAKQIPIKRMIFSGDLVDNSSLRDSVEKFTSLTIDTLVASMFVKNCTDRTFQEYLLPIAATYATSSYNFLAIDFREEKLFRTVLTKLNAVLLIILLASVGFAYTRYTMYNNMQKDIELRAKKLTAKVHQLAETIGDKNVLMFQNAYIEKLWRRQMTPVNLLVPSQTLLERNLYSVVDFSNTGENSVMLMDEKKFNSFEVAYLYEQKYIEFLNNFATVEGLFPDMKSTLDIPQRVFHIRTDISGQPKIFKVIPVEKGETSEKK